MNTTNLDQVSSERYLQFSHVQTEDNQAVLANQASQVQNGAGQGAGRYNAQRQMAGQVTGAELRRCVVRGQRQVRYQQILQTARELSMMRRQSGRE